MKKIGLTGGIGSGKTYVSKVFEKLGFPVFNADNYAKEYMHTDQDLVKAIIREFGSDIYKDRKLQAKVLASIVFNDQEKLNQLNSLVHPIVKKGFIDWCFQINSKLVIKEAAILFESDSHIGLDAVICVVCPEEIRIERVMKRDNVNRSEVLSRIDQQMDVEKQKALSSYIIVNDGKHMVVPQVLDIIKEMG